MNNIPVEIKHESTLYAEQIFHLHNFGVTNALLTSWLAVLIIIILSLIIRFSIKKIPGRTQSFFEMMVEGGLGVADQVTGDRKTSEKIFPIAICIFFFVLINNWLGLLPLGGFGLVQEGTFVPFLRSSILQSLLRSWQCSEQTFSELYLLVHGKCSINMLI